MNKNKSLSHRFGRCMLVTAVSLLFMDNSVAAHKHKRKPQRSSQALLREVQQRDALIKNLLLRVEALENSRNPMPASQQEQLAGNNPPPRQDAPVNTQTNKTSSPPPQAEAPGQFTIDEQASQRALERTLAKSGVLLLPSGFLDTDFSFSFTHKEVPALFNQGTLDQLTGQARQNIFEPSLAFRLGLPFDSQLEFNLPYRFVDQSVVAANQNLNIKANGSGLGDVQIGFAKTLLHEERWWPDLIARVRWNTDSGEKADGGLGLGGGTGSITGSLSVLKRQDPLAFFFNASYTKSFTQKDYFTGANGLKTSYNPGDIVAFSIGTQLAASADTSLSFSLDQLFVSNIDQGGNTIDGSNRNIGVLSIGASSIISRNFFVNLSVGMGLTDDAPDYTTGITLSNRTNLKPYLGLN